jgi:capsular polysaccharide biosynthesis protein
MVKRNAIIILAITIIAYMSSYYYYRYTAVPTYTASVQMVIQITDELVGKSTSASGSISLAERVGETCKIIFKDKLFLEELSDTLDNKYSAGQLGGMLSVYTVEESEILGVSVTSTDPQASADVANAFLKAAPFFFKNVYSNTRIVALSEADVPTVPNYVDLETTGLKYALLAFVVSAGIALLIEALNAKVKSEDNLFEIYGAPVFANIPDMLQAENRSKKYKYEYEYGYEDVQDKGGNK